VFHYQYALAVRIHQIDLINWTRRADVYTFRRVRVSRYTGSGPMFFISKNRDCRVLLGSSGCGGLFLLRTSSSNPRDSPATSLAGISEIVGILQGPQARRLLLLASSKLLHSLSNNPNTSANGSVINLSRRSQTCGRLGTARPRKRLRRPATAGLS